MTAQELKSKWPFSFQETLQIFLLLLSAVYFTVAMRTELAVINEKFANHSSGLSDLASAVRLLSADNGRKLEGIGETLSEITQEQALMRYRLEQLEGRDLAPR